MKIFIKKKFHNGKKLPAFSVLEVMFAGIIFLIMLFFVNQFLSQILNNPSFQVDSEEVFKKIQNFSGYPDPSATPVDARVDLLYKFSRNSCHTNDSDWDCQQVELKLPSNTPGDTPSDKSVFWYLYIKR